MQDSREVTPFFVLRNPRIPRRRVWKTLEQGMKTIPKNIMVVSGKIV